MVSMIIIRTLGSKVVKISFKVVIYLLARMVENASQIIGMSLSRFFPLKRSAIGRSDKVSFSMRNIEEAIEGYFLNDKNIERDVGHQNGFFTLKRGHMYEDLQKCHPQHFKKSWSKYWVYYVLKIINDKVMFHFVFTTNTSFKKASKPS